MTLPFYLFRQFIPPFIFGTILFLFVLVLEKLFDLVDLVFNKGVSLLIVGKLFLFFFPTVLPLTLPMAVLLASMVTFGRLSEENEILAIRSSGISLIKVFWIPPFFAFLVSVSMVPFNTLLAPYSHRAFRQIFQKIVQAEPLINFAPRQLVAIKDLKILADSINKETDTLNDVFVYQVSSGEGVRDRIFARKGKVESSNDLFKMTLKQGQFQRYDPSNPQNLIHAHFGTHEITFPINFEQKFNSTKFRSIPSHEIKGLIQDLKSKGHPTTSLEAENALRYAMAFAPFALILVGIPLATAMKKGGRGFAFGVTIVVVFIYYLFLITGLTLAEKGSVPAHLSLWMANGCCLLFSGILVFRMARK